MRIYLKVQKMFESCQNDEKNNREEGIICAVKNNDALAFVELLGIYSKTISLIASSFSLPSGELDDLCQEGRIALFKAAQSYDGNSSKFSTYASVCIKNAMTNWAKKYGKSTFSEIKNESCDSFEQKDAGVDIEGEVIADNLLCTILEDGYAHLSKSEKYVLEKKISGCSIEEISREIGKSTKSIENTLFRARKKIRQKLGK